MPILIVNLELLRSWKVLSPQLTVKWFHIELVFQFYQRSHLGILKHHFIRLDIQVQVPDCVEAPNFFIIWMPSFRISVLRMISSFIEKRSNTVTPCFSITRNIIPSGYLGNYCVNSMSISRGNPSIMLFRISIKASISYWAPDCVEIVFALRIINLMTTCWIWLACRASWTTP